MPSVFIVVVKPLVFNSYFRLFRQTWYGPGQKHRFSWTIYVLHCYRKWKTCTVQYINFLYSMTTIISKFVSSVVNSFQIYLWRTTSCFNSCFIHEFLYTHEPMQFYFLFPGIEKRVQYNTSISYTLWLQLFKYLYLV